MARSDQIHAAVESATGVAPEVIKSDRRTAQISTARFLAMLLYAESRPFASNQDAAISVGKLDPGTGRHGLMRARHLLKNNAEFQSAHQKATAILAIKPTERDENARLNFQLCRASVRCLVRLCARPAGRWRVANQSGRIGESKSEPSSLDIRGSEQGAWHPRQGNRPKSWGDHIRKRKTRNA